MDINCIFRSKSFKINLTCDLDENNVLTIQNFHNTRNDTTPTKINIDFLINQDKENFEKLNKLGDEKHQIDIKSLKIRDIVITDEIQPQIRITYSFKQSDEFRRLCAGETAIMDKGILNIYTAICVYTKGCVVYW